MLFQFDCSFARRLEDFFNPILLMNLMVSSLLICMVGFQLMTVSTYVYIEWITSTCCRTNTLSSYNHHRAILT